VPKLVTRRCANIEWTLTSKSVSKFGQIFIFNSKLNYKRSSTVIYSAKGNQCSDFYLKNSPLAWCQMTSSHWRKSSQIRGWQLAFLHWWKNRLQWGDNMWTFIPSLPMLRWTPHTSHAMLRCHILSPCRSILLFYPICSFGNPRQPRVSLGPMRPNLMEFSLNPSLIFRLKRSE